MHTVPFPWQVPTVDTALALIPGGYLAHVFPCSQNETKQRWLAFQFGQTPCTISTKDANGPHTSAIPIVEALRASFLESGGSESTRMDEPPSTKGFGRSAAGGPKRQVGAPRLNERGTRGRLATFQESNGTRPFFFFFFYVLKRSKMVVGFCCRPNSVPQKHQLEELNGFQPTIVQPQWSLRAGSMFRCLGLLGRRF